jgi:DDE superfamily endonuclease
MKSLREAERFKSAPRRVCTCKSRHRHSTARYTVVHTTGQNLSNLSLVSQGIAALANESSAIKNMASVHVILDSYAVHKHPKVRQWLDRHPRFAFHFTPTSCSWLNAVEGSSPSLPNRDCGVFRCVVDLQATINRFVAQTNNDPKPFTWAAPRQDHRRCQTRHQVLDSIH